VGQTCRRYGENGGYKENLKERDLSAGVFLDDRIILKIILI